MLKVYLVVQMARDPKFLFRVYDAQPCGFCARKEKVWQLLREGNMGNRTASPEKLTGVIRCQVIQSGSKKRSGHSRVGVDQPDELTVFCLN